MKFETIDRIELRALLCFERVATLGSFSVAARQLDLPRAAVSRIVQKLEDQVGAKLFQRTTRSLSLTAEGQALVDTSLPALSSLRAALLEASVTAKDVRGTVRFSVSQALGRHLVSPVLPSFSKDYPHVQVDMSVGDDLDDLISDSLDFAIRIGDLPDSSMITRKLAEIDVMLAIPASLAQDRHLPRTIADLDAFPQIGFRVPGTQSLYHWHFGTHGQIHTVIPNTPNLTTDSIDDVAQLVCQGAGIAPLPSYLIADALKDGTLLVGLPDYTLPSVPLQLCFPSRGKRPVRVDALADHLEVQIKALLH